VPEPQFRVVALANVGTILPNRANALAPFHGYAGWPFCARRRARAELLLAQRAAKRNAGRALR